ncbi:hypothetical protein F0562_031280 [Nyssa sinensis]|uniref:Cytochrome P450 n=1 Tax=Nyssa sinensis TaxID=561372 RepID=A0A5J5ARY0_9ASTE|nr:hypothetical protein F0562_031280 [Nyssa sinensis]
MNLIPGEINLIFFPLILPSLLLIFVFLNLKWTSLIRRPPLPPGPFAWPLVGNIFQMGKNPHVVLANLAQLHGPLISLRLGARVLVVASSPEAAAEVLKTHDRALSGRYVSRPLRIKGSKLYNLSVGFSEECSDHWKSLRNIYRSELFSGKAMESQVEVRENKVAEMVKYLSAKEGQVVKIKEIMVISALNMLSNALFSMDIANFEGDGQEMGELIRRYTEAGATRPLSDLYPIFAGWDPQCMYKKVMDYFDKISAVWIDIVKERRKQRNNVSSGQDFLDALHWTWVE